MKNFNYFNFFEKNLSIDISTSTDGFGGSLSFIAPQAVRLTPIIEYQDSVDLNLLSYYGYDQGTTSVLGEIFGPTRVYQNFSDFSNPQNLYVEGRAIPQYLQDLLNEMSSSPVQSSLWSSATRSDSYSVAQYSSTLASAACTVSSIQSRCPDQSITISIKFSGSERKEMMLYSALMDTFQKAGVNMSHNILFEWHCGR